MKSKLIRLLVVCVAGLMSQFASGGEKPILEVDFTRSIWTELLKKDYGPTLSVVNGALQMAPGTVCRTIKLPYVPGQIIKVSVEAACENVTQGSSDFMVGWSTVTGYDAAQAAIGHNDLLQIRGTCDWQTYTNQFSFNEQCGYFTVDLTHQGSTGTVWYRNLKISIIDEGTLELIGDSGFEGQLGVDHWYYKQSGTDWDGLSLWSSLGSIGYDTSVVIAGLNSLKMVRCKTMVSKDFPYNGEYLMLSAWLRSSSLVGTGGGVQLVGLDQAGAYVCHENLKIITGTKAWQFCTMNKTFPDSVKKVQVWLRVFSNTTGTLWLDEVRLQQMDEAPLPFDAANATVTLDAANPGATIKADAWSGADALYSWWLLRSDVQQCLPYLKKAGMKYLRLREISNGLNLYDQDDASGNPVYSWTKFDQLFDLLVQTYDFIPVVTIETTPPALDRPGTRIYGWTNPTPPSDFQKWGAYIEAVFDHAVQRYGSQEVSKWLWEIWNEPCLPSTAGYYIGSTADFISLAEQVYLAAERVEQRYNMNLQIGLTSGGIGEEYILNYLQSLGKLSWVDHHTGHYYAGATSSIRQVPMWVRELSDYKTLYPGMNDYKTGCTEWNCTSMQSQLLDLPWNATMAFKMSQVFVDSNLDYSTYFGLVDHPENYSLPPALFISGGSQGMFTRSTNPVPKPVYNAFVFLNELRGGKRIPLTTVSNPIDGMASLKEDGSIDIVINSYDENISRQPYTTSVSVTIQGVDEKLYKCTRLWAADEQYGNSYGAWVSLGEPEVDDEDAKKLLAQKSRYAELAPVDVYRDGTTLQFTIAVPSPGLRFIEIRPFETDIVKESAFNDASGTACPSYWNAYTSVANAPAIVQNGSGQLVVPVGVGDGGLKGQDAVYPLGSQFYRFETDVYGDGCHVQGFESLNSAGPHFYVRSDCGNYWVIELSNGSNYARYTTDLSAWSRFPWAMEWAADSARVYAKINGAWELVFDTRENSPDAGSWVMPSGPMIPIVMGYWANSAVNMMVNSLKLEKSESFNAFRHVEDLFDDVSGSSVTSGWSATTTVSGAPAITQNGSGQLVVTAGPGEGKVIRQNTVLPDTYNFYRFETGASGSGCQVQGFTDNTSSGQHVLIRNDCGSQWVAEISGPAGYARYTMTPSAWSKYEWAIEWCIDRVKVYVKSGTSWQLTFDSMVNAPDSGTWSFPTVALYPFVSAYSVSAATMYVDYLRIDEKYLAEKVGSLLNESFSGNSGAAIPSGLTGTTTVSGANIVQTGNGTLLVPVGPGQGIVKGTASYMPDETSYYRYDFNAFGSGSKVYGFTAAASDYPHIYVRNDCGNQWEIEIAGDSGYDRYALNLSSWYAYPWRIEWHVNKVLVYAFIGGSWQVQFDSELSLPPSSGQWNFPASAMVPFVSGYSSSAADLEVDFMNLQKVEMKAPVF